MAAIVWYDCLHVRDSAMIPNDPMMLLSFINMKLRDDYDSLDELCRSLDIDKEKIKAKLGSIGYTYNREINQFK